MRRTCRAKCLGTFVLMMGLQMTVTHEPAMRCINFFGASFFINMFSFHLCSTIPLFDVSLLDTIDPLWNSQFHERPLVIELITSELERFVAGDELKRLGVTATWILDGNPVDGLNPQGSHSYNVGPPSDVCWFINPSNYM